MAFDFGKQSFSKAAEVGAWVDLVLPNHEKPGVKLHILGGMSQAVKEHDREKLRKLTTKKRGKEVEITPEFIEETQVEDALVRLIGWSGVESNGKPVEFDKEVARGYLVENPWLCAFIMEESADVQNFPLKP